MPRRGENIRKRSDGRWEARYPKGTDENGKTTYASVYADTYKAVKEKRRIITDTANAQKQVANCSRITLQMLLEQWLEHNRVRLKESTIYRYRYLMEKHIIPDIGDQPVSEISHRQLEAFLSKKANQGRLDGNGALSPAYIRSMMLVVSSALKYASSEGLCGNPPLSLPVGKSTAVRKKIAALSREEQEQLEKALQGRMDETGIGVYISLYAGLRIGEICALSWEDVDLENRVIHVRHTVTRTEKKNAAPGGIMIGCPKTPSSLRSIPICSRLFCVLSGYSAEASGRYLAGNGDRFLSPRTFAYRYRMLLERNNLSYLNFHGLRHTFATRCVEAGVDIKSLSEILGHSSVAITLNTYVHSSIDLKRAQLEKLSAYLE